MTNKEEALKFIKDNTLLLNEIKSNIQVISLNTAERAIERAAKTDWFSPAEEQYPEINLPVICVLYSGSMAGYKYLETKLSFYNGRKFICEFDWVYVKVWTYLPKFSE